MACWLAWLVSIGSGESPATVSAITSSSGAAASARSLLRRRRKSSARLRAISPNQASGGLSELR